MDNRRNFLKKSTALCGGALLAGMALSAGCKTPAVAAANGAKPTAITMVNGEVSIPVSDFKELNARVIDVAKGPKLLVTKNADGTYSALEYKCPHAGGPLENRDGELVCPWHDSRFTLDGTLKQGPAKTGLTKYPTTINGDVILVKVG